MAAFFSRPAPAAVKIVAPPRADGSPAPSSTQDQNQLKLCSNYAKFGSCQFEGVGCIFYHPPKHERSPMEPSSSASDLSRTTSPLPTSQARQNVNAPVFVPKSAMAAEAHRSSGTSGLMNSIPSPPPSDSLEYDSYDPYDLSRGNNNLLSPDLMSSMQNMQLNNYDTGANSMAQSQYLGQPSAASGMDPYYQANLNAFIRQPLNYHLYTPSAHNAPSSKSDHPQANFFISDTLRQDLTQRAEAIRAMPLGPSPNLPEELQGYHTLVILDHSLPTKDRRPNFFGALNATVYKAISSVDGLAYVLRRIENFRLINELAFGAIEQWSRIRHPNIVSVREAFTTRAFNDNSLIVAYDYHPNSVTLMEAHLKSSQRGQPLGLNPHAPAPVPETILWSYIAQIGSAIRAVHAAGMAVRILDASKVLLTGKNRIRVACCGIADVIAYDTRQDIQVLQQDDLLNFGRLILALCCNNPNPTVNVNKSLETLMRNYSPEFKQVVIFLISKPSPMKSINKLWELIGSRLVTEMEALQHQNDRLEGELASELENGRLVRLLCKLGFINERPEFDRDSRWSDTGDRYIIKLFRDYVFHQVDEHGNPVVNLSHVLTCLNKLDAGTEERIMLISRDEQSCLVVSYKELKACIESTFGELARATSR